MSHQGLKKAQRRQLLQIRRHLPLWFKQTCAHLVCKAIMALPLYQQANRLALYHAMDHEIALDELWHHALSQGKTCYFPVLLPNKQLSFVPADESALFIPNRWGIPEPVHRDAVALQEINLFLLPLIGFDNQGNRLGTGAGCYDRTLAQVENPHCIGVGYAFQQLSTILTEPTDVPLDLVVTEHGPLYPSLRTP